jgi:amidase
VSVVDVVSRRLAALDRAEPLHAVAWRADDAVLAQAEEADRALRRGDSVGALHGVPVSVKDWIDVVGFPCAAGWPEHRERRPAHDATTAHRLRAAGAIVIAKSNVGETNALHGPAANPHDPNRTPGHSSSGEAVLVSTGVSTLGLGSDSGGSLRFPAHCCGIATLKPTYGRVPVTGHFPRVGELADGRTVIGPLARTVEDLELAIGLLAGPDGRDPAVPPVAPVAPTSVDGLRVAVQRSGGDEPLAPEILAAVDAAGAALASGGAAVIVVDPLDVADALDITNRYWHRRELAVGETDRLLEDWDRFRRNGMRLLGRFDLIVSPAAPHPAPLIGASTDADWRFTLSASLWGWPALVVRAGTSVEGLPLGVQVVAGPWREDRALAAGRLIEAELGPWPLAPLPA